MSVWMRVQVNGVVGPHLVIPGPSGVLYEKRVGQVQTVDKMLEGFLVPLSWQDRTNDLIDAIFCGEDEFGLAAGSVAELERLWDSDPFLTYITVDRDRLEESCWRCVWVSLVASNSAASKMGPMSLTLPSKGVLFW